MSPSLFDLRSAFLSAAVIYGALVALLTLELGVSSKLRDLAESISRHLLIIGALYVLGFEVLLVLTSFPFLLASTLILKWPARGLSRLPSAYFSAGILKTLLVGWGFCIVFAWSRRRWWIYFFAALSIVGAVRLIWGPFRVPSGCQSLAQIDPVLSSKAQTLIRKAHLPSYFEQVLVTEKPVYGSDMNAGVFGFGSSARIVVSKEIITEMAPDEVMAVIAHEAGHCVFDRRVKDLLFPVAISAAVLLGILGLFEYVLARCRSRWRLRPGNDIAAYPLFYLIFAIAMFLQQPILNSYYRHREHLADRYSLELLCGSVHDPTVTVIEELAWFHKPGSSAFEQFWFFDHPSLEQRIEFARTYEPCAKAHQR